MKDIDTRLKTARYSLKQLFQTQETQVTLLTADKYL